tara:strand:+ start:1417 stop:2175 length:759 start_codon:yes stop_codon:yes gene_type:complete
MELKTYNNINFFQSNLLIEHDFKHAFFTKKLRNNKPIELQNGLDIASNIHSLNQIHSDKVIQVKNTLCLKPKTADSLITKEPNQSLWIYTADCMPLLFADINTRNIAACHSGLQGLKNQIISKTLKELEGIGSKKKDLIIAIGPSIKGDKYQVKKKEINDLILQVTGGKYIKKSSYLVELNKKEIIPLLKRDDKPDRLLIDIQAAAILQLYMEGIKEYQININRLCTYSNPKLFNSFRRDNNCLRQWNCIYS